MRKHLRLGATLAVAASLVGALSFAGPANAATPAPVSDTTSAVQTPPAAPAVGASPAYVAGAVYYVCIETNGSTLTVLYNQKVETKCKGAEAVSVYYDSGQFIRTVRLDLQGKPGPHLVANAQDCVLAVIGTAVLIGEPTLSWGWYVTSGITGVGLTSCISQ